MRKSLLTLALLGLMAGAALAQFRFGFGQQPVGDALLGNKSVQDELKLTEAQQKQVAEIAKTSREAMAKLRELFAEDREKAMEVMKKNQEETTKAYKKLREGLSSKQAKRFEEIQIQVAAKNNQADIFSRADVVKSLSLTAKQKAAIKDNMTELEKDLKEITDDLKSNPAGFREALPKMQKLRKDTFDKITKTFTAEQKKTWTDMQGAAFEYKQDAFGKGGKGKKKKDDF